MADDPQSRFEQTHALDPHVNTANREGLTGTAQPDLYSPTREAEDITVPPDSRPQSEQPQWRKDFPIDWPSDQYVARRDFVKFLTLTSCAFVAGQAWVGAQQLLKKHRRSVFPRTKIASLSEVPIGTAIMFKYPEAHNGCLLIRLGENELVAYSQACTHLSCAVVPKVDEGILLCPCHNGYFDLRTGVNIAGPPPRPLPKIELEIKGDDIFAVGVEERSA